MIDRLLKFFFLNRRLKRLQKDLYYFSVDAELSDEHRARLIFETLKSIREVKLEIESLKN